MRLPLILTAVFVLCVGCTDVAGRQQRAEEARKQQTVDDLRKLGESMHNNQPGDPAAGSAATDAAARDPNSPQNNVDSSK